MPLTNGPDPDQGVPKTYGSDGSVFGSGSETLVLCIPSPQALVCPSDFNRKNDKMVLASPDSSKASPAKGRSGKGGSGLVARTAALRLEVRNTRQVLNVKKLVGVGRY